MKIMLVAINSKYIHSNLAVYSLKSFSEEFEDLIAIKEYTINNRQPEILKDIYVNKPDVLFFFMLYLEYRIHKKNSLI